MNVTLSKLASAGLFFVFIFLSGFWLNRRGSPYHMLLVTVHKLIGLAAGVFLGWIIYTIHQVTALSTIQIIAVVIVFLLFSVNVATGSLLSTNNPMPKTVAIVNKFLPYLTVIATGIMLYLLS